MADRISKSFVLENVTISYPQLLEAKAPQFAPEGDPVYSVVALWPKDPANKNNVLIKEALEYVTRENPAIFKNIQHPKFTVWDGDQPNNSGEERGEECKGMYGVSLKTKNRPAVVDQSLQPIIDREEIYPGALANIAVNMYPYSHPTGGKGISIGLNHVMILPGGKRLAVGAPSVETAFSGFATQAAPASTINPFTGQPE